jgi:hypothetical protein
VDIINTDAYFVYEFVFELLKEYMLAIDIKVKHNARLYGVSIDAR